ncbi:MAG: secY [Gammaproteobacteria bacterium]|jgi:preprotein translocase subunit SecY|nr:secY [Gammaproteobacteria bacterium]
MSQIPQAPLATAAYKDVGRRLFFLLLILLFYRLGAHIPVPGLDAHKVANLVNSQHNGILSLFNMFSGNALLRMSVFALGIMPYISASIILQLLTSMVPSLEQLKKEGEQGRRKINEYTRYLTLFIAFLQAIGICKWLVAQGVVLIGGFSFYFISMVTLITGTMLILWLGEQITERGVGNGISMIIFAGIVSGLPSAIARTFEQVRQGQLQFLSLIVITVVVLGVVAFVVFMERAQRRIAINYPQRMQGRRMMAAQSSHLPFKINMSGVIPPIFASSIILLPATLFEFFGNSLNHNLWLSQLNIALSPGQPLYIALFAAAIIFFCFFYTAIVFNPRETAENLKKSGAFIPGIRPGEQTANYIDLVITRLTLVGAIYLVLVALLPELMTITWHVQFFFGGTSLLIIVVVTMDFMAQLQSHLLSQQYEGLMKKGKF